MDKNSLFEKNLSYLDLKFKDSLDFLNFIGIELEKTGYTKGGFTQALLERERNYPTGLPSVPYPVAIPHCDPKYITEEKIVCVRFKNPVEFIEMGTFNKKINVHFAFVLLMKGKKQVSVLQTLMPIFMNEEFMLQMEKVEDKFEFVSKMEEKFYEKES